MKKSLIVLSCSLAGSADSAKNKKMSFDLCHSPPWIRPDLGLLFPNIVMDE